jgi:FtsH-binding integral membrane protein
MSEIKTEFKPSLSAFDATMIVAGSMIGSGIFIVSADITRNVGSAGWLVAVWLLTGFMTLTAIFIASMVNQNSLLSFLAVIALAMGYVAIYARMIRFQWCSPILFLITKPQKSLKS